MPNRLAAESSPYLLQHANNPVEWWPWGPAAFDEARRRNVPILLSIGYSTCYWCHVMERESFENPAVAAVMNRHLVCIKLDREERPDVDDIYMAATVIMRGQGGWPMNVFIEPAKLRPFWAGTYFPPEPRGEMPGFPQVVEALAQAWRTRRAEVEDQAAALAGAVQDQLADTAGHADIGPPQVSAAVEMLLRMYDRSTGGFGRAPKFPQPALLELLLAVRGRSADAATRDAIDQAVRGTLDAMLIGGIRDHVGGGFHRYAVDQTWTVPHFEKMLYDNAQLLGVYARASVEYNDGEYARAAGDAAAYVLREMTAPDGTFFSAQDAEVDHREGLNYLWTPEQVRGCGLAQPDAELAIRVYSLSRGPNFRDPHHPADPPANVLRMEARLEELARREGFAVPALVEKLIGVNRSLLTARSKRKQPHLDDKTIVAWNAMMISSLADAGVILNEPGWVVAAARALDRILATMAGPDGLRRVSRAGKPAATRAFLEDHAFLVQAMCAVARARPNLRAELSKQAATLAHTALHLFADGGKLFDAPADQQDLFVRPSSTHDGAVPSGASAFIHAMIDLADLTADRAWNHLAISALRAMSARIAESPASCVGAVRALFRLLTTDPLAAAALAPAGAPAESPPTPRQDAFTPVEIYADTERVSVTRESPGLFSVVMRIAPGYHVIAADPGEGGAGLAPFRVDIGGGAGLSVFADYPAGHPRAAPGIAPPHPLVYTGEVELKIVVERTGDLTGRPLLRAVFQACSDTACLKPTTVELDVAIDA